MKHQLYYQSRSHHIYKNTLKLCSIPDINNKRNDHFHNPISIHNKNKTTESLENKNSLINITQSKEKGGSRHPQNLQPLEMKEKNFTQRKTRDRKRPYFHSKTKCH